MSAKRNHYTSTPLMRMDKHPKSVEWEEPPVVLEQDAVGRVRHYRLLQLIYGPKKLLNGDETRVFFDAPAARSAVAYPHVGSVFDGSEF